ncbi:MAG: ribosomal subunit interface protein [Candidatus Adlerbacteria bacterium]|nr:ribosomal subunit interface protein [Candidatus Adlerbacteria bacterium]
MNYNVKGTHVTLTAEIHDYLDKKLAILDKLIQGNVAARVDVELEYLQDEAKMYRTELMLHDGSVWRVEAQGSTLHEAIDIASAELFNELTRAKKKKMHVFRHSAVRVKEYLRGWRKDM